MLVENKYPLEKEVLSQLLKLKLETEEDSTMALELIRFVKKQIAELEPENSDGDEKGYFKLAIPEQTAIGKGIPNPLMAGSLPKTKKPTELDVAVLLKRQVTDGRWIAAEYKLLKTKIKIYDKGFGYIPKT
ncbi:hypothetical protein Tco_1499904 [Tanacetum coccineum]